MGGMKNGRANEFAGFREAGKALGNSICYPYCFIK